MPSTIQPGVRVASLVTNVPLTGQDDTQPFAVVGDAPVDQAFRTNAHYQIISSGTGTASVPLSSLTMRYWFTNETPADPLVFVTNIDITDSLCSRELCCAFGRSEEMPRGGHVRTLG